MLLILRVHLDLVIPGEAVYKGHPFEPARIVNNDVRDRERELIFRTRHIQIAKINADPNLPVFLGNGDDVGDLVGMLFLSDESRVNKFLDFQFNRLHDFRTKPPLLLLDGFYLWANVEVMHGYLWVEARHIFIVPREDIYVFSFERY